jgi:hypothetical protein
MAEFICRLGTPAGEIVTRTIEAVGAQERRELLVKEQEVVGLEPRVRAAAASSRQRGHARCLRRRHSEDTKALAFEAYARFLHADRFDCARHNLSGGRS